MKGMILAAGLGTRLRPLTWSTPKPMVPLCNRPLIAWAVEAYLAAGVGEILVNLHHLPEPIERFLANDYAGIATFAFSHESRILGTGGALKRIRPLVEDADELFVVNGDTLQFPRYGALRDARRAYDALAALTLRPAPADDRFTPVWTDGGHVTGFGSGHGTALMFAGSHCVARRLFDRFPADDVFGIVDRVYQPLLAEGQPLAAVVDEGLWFDVGTAARYLAAGEALLAAIVGGAVAVPRGSRLAGDALTGEGAIVSGTLRSSSAAHGARVEGTVSRSILWERCVVGTGVRLERCLVADGVELRGPLELRDTVICRDTPAIPADVPRRDGLVLVPVT